jgi:hypothetical protein
MKASIPITYVLFGALVGPARVVVATTPLRTARTQSSSWPFGHRGKSMPFAERLLDDDLCSIVAPAGVARRVMSRFDTGFRAKKV